MAKNPTTASFTRREEAISTGPGTIRPVMNTVFFWSAIPRSVKDVDGWARAPGGRSSFSTCQAWRLRYASPLRCARFKAPVLAGQPTVGRRLWLGVYVSCGWCTISTSQ